MLRLTKLSLGLLSKEFDPNWELGYSRSVLNESMRGVPYAAWLSVCWCPVLDLVITGVDICEIVKCLRCLLGGERNSEAPMGGFAFNGRWRWVNCVTNVSWKWLLLMFDISARLSTDDSTLLNWIYGIFGLVYLMVCLGEVLSMGLKSTTMHVILSVPMPLLFWTSLARPLSMSSPIIFLRCSFLSLILLLLKFFLMNLAT